MWPMSAYIASPPVETHLRHLLNSYQKYYNEIRTYLSLRKDAPIPRDVWMTGHVVAVPILGGLHHRYCSSLSLRQGQAIVPPTSRELLATPSPSKEPQPSEPTATDEQRVLPCPCPCCGGRMIIIETFARGSEPHYRASTPSGTIRIDTS
jgi:hypothetical protein